MKIKTLQLPSGVIGDPLIGGSLKELLPNIKSLGLWCGAAPLPRNISHIWPDLEALAFFNLFWEETSFPVMCKLFVKKIDTLLTGFSWEQMKEANAIHPNIYQGFPGFPSLKELLGKQY